MRRHLWTGVSMLVVAVLGAAAYAELVLDWRAPRSQLAQSGALSFNSSHSIAALSQIAEEMKAKYGEGAETYFVPGGQIRVELDGKVVHEARSPGRVSSVLGLFVAGPAGALESRFPFEIGPVDWRWSQETALVESIKNRFGDAFPAGHLDFTDLDWMRDSCVQFAAVDLGAPGRWLPVRGGTGCVVRWKGRRPASMLVTVTQADGDPWMRPFSRRVCRRIAETAVAKLMIADGWPLADYAACVLVDRPTRADANELMEVHVYELRADGALARIR